MSDNNPFKKKSLKLNMILSAVKGVMGILFPLITFPYISKVLGLVNVGRYNFANSVISYFVLFAGLGIQPYAIREGAAVREDRKKIKLFADELFTINICSTAASYVLLMIAFMLVPKFHNYKALLLILSLQITFKTVGIEWIYSIYEEYAYITIRSIAFQVISLLLLFLFIKDSGDTDVYAMITVVSGAGSNLLNYIYARRFYRPRLSWKVSWKKHIKPILILFAMSVTISLYVNSDITILGFLCGDAVVGIYSVSTKVYSVVKTILSAVLVVSIPRLSAFAGEENWEKFSATAEDIYKTLLSVVIPAVCGILILRNQVVQLISSAEFLPAASSLCILCVALLFCMGAWFWGQCILIPIKQDMKVFSITV